MLLLLLPLLLLHSILNPIVCCRSNCLVTLTSRPRPLPPTPNKQRRSRAAESPFYNQLFIKRISSWELKNNKDKKKKKKKTVCFQKRNIIEVSGLFPLLNLRARGALAPERASGRVLWTSCYRFQKIPVWRSFLIAMECRRLHRKIS